MGQRPQLMFVMGLSDVQTTTENDRTIIIDPRWTYPGFHIREGDMKPLLVWKYS